MIYIKTKLLFSHKEELEVIGSKKQIKRIIEFMEKNFKVKRSSGWFTKK